MKERGFTLVELLAVIIVLGLIGIITIPSVTRVIRDSKEKLYQEQIRTLEYAAKKWGTANIDNLPVKDSDIYQLSFQKLHSDGYIETNPVINPKTNDNLAGCILVRYQSAYHQYKYNYFEECNPEDLNSWKPPIISVLGSNENQTLVLAVMDSYTIPEGTAVDYEGNELEVKVSGDITPDIPGTYEIRYEAVDTKGISSILVLTIEIIDENEPTIEYVINGMQNNGWYHDNVIIQLSGDDRGRPVSRYEYRLKTNTGYSNWVSITKGSFTLYNDGPDQQFQVRSKSRNGVYSEILESPIIKIDKTRPQISTVTLSPDGPTGGPVTVTIVGSDSLSGISSYSFDEGATWQESNQKAFSSNQSVYVMVKDYAGNTSTSRGVLISKIETKQPTIEFVTVGAPFNNNGWATTNFNINVISHVGQSGIKANTFKYCISSNGSDCTPNTVISSPSQGIQIGSESANNKICASVMDNANQSSGVICSNTYKLDKTAPKITSIGKSPSGWTHNNITLTVNAEDNISGVSLYSYDNGVSWTTSKTKVYSSNASAFTVIVKNGAGLTATQTGVAITNKETVTPKITFSPASGASWATSDIAVTITGTVGKSGIKANTFKYCISTNGNNCTPGTVISATSQRVTITANSANNKICATLTDGAGLSTNTVCSGLYKLDKTTPTITAKAASYTINQGTSVDPKTYFNIGAFGVSGGTTSCSVANTKTLAVGTTTVTCTSTAGNGRKASASTKVVVKANAQTTTDIANSAISNGSAEKIGNTTYFRGSNPNNWIRFNGVSGDNEWWKIISIENGFMKIIRNTPISGQAWDNTPTYGSNVWIRPATLNTYLNGTYKNSLPTTISSKIQYTSFYIGGVTWNTTNATAAGIKNEERQVTPWMGYVGLMNASDYVYASKDSNCATKAINNANCKNYNWLYDAAHYQWTINASSSYSNNVMYVYTDGHLNYYNASNTRPVSRPVIHLRSDVKIATGGTGTSVNPYVIQ